MEEKEKMTAEGAEAKEAPPEEAAAAEAKGKALEDKAAGLEAKLAAAVRQYDRLQGDFDNFRRRTRAEQAEAKEKHTADTVKEFLPVLDNFDRALAHMAKDAGGAAYVQGFEMLKKQLEKVLEGAGRFRCDGDPGGRRGV